MPNRRQHDHIGNFNFKVEIEGVTQGAFWMGADSAFDGRDKFSAKHRRPGHKSFGNITLKKGYIASEFRESWLQLTTGGPRNRYTGFVIQFDRSGKETGRWNLYDCFPKSWTVSDSANADIGVEEVTIAFEGVVYQGG